MIVGGMDKVVCSCSINDLKMRCENVRLFSREPSVMPKWWNLVDTCA